MTNVVHLPRAAANEKFGEDTGVQGKETAKKLARIGRIISAIKLLELMNPKISRQHAKTIVNSFGYSNESRWPEDDSQPVRCL